jgi:8-oxo-dGTP pyrophosphatase MutT (NUDIX family)
MPHAKKPVEDASVRAAGLMIVTPQGDALFLRDHGGEWGFPAGGLEDDETPDVAAIRETREETGWTPQDAVKQIDASDDFVLYATVSQNQFIPELSDEHDAWCWAPLSNPPTPLLPELEEELNGLLAQDTGEDKLAHQAISAALTAALWHLANVWEPHLDREIEHLVDTFQDRFDVSRARARELLAPVVAKARGMAKRGIAKDAVSGVMFGMHYKATDDQYQRLLAARNAGASKNEIRRLINSFAGTSTKESAFSPEMEQQYKEYRRGGAAGPPNNRTLWAKEFEARLRKQLGEDAYGANAATKSELRSVIKFPPDKPKETRAINEAYARGGTTGGAAKQSVEANKFINSGGATEKDRERIGRQQALLGRDS